MTDFSLCTTLMPFQGDLLTVVYITGSLQHIFCMIQLIVCQLQLMFNMLQLM